MSFHFEMFALKAKYVTALLRSWKRVALGHTVGVTTAKNSSWLWPTKFIGLKLQREVVD